MSIRLSIGLLSIIGLISSCQLAHHTPFSDDYSFFPIETGHYVIYDVLEYHYALNVSTHTATYQLKERIGSPFTDVTGQVAYPLLRYRRSNDGEPWQTDSTHVVRLIENEAIRTENGQDFIKLVFPIKNQAIWNGNQRNNLSPDEYTLRNTEQPYYVLTKRFDETVTVVAQDDSTLTAQDKRVEVYARQIGMIYKEKMHVQFCTASPSCIGRSLIDYGTRYVYRIQTYGKE